MQKRRGETETIHQNAPGGGAISLKPILLAARPKTLPAAVVPVWAG